MKQCVQCDRMKEHGQFYRHPKSADGLQGVCKECHKDRMRSRYNSLSNDPEWRELERARARDKYRRLYSRNKRTKGVQYRASYTVTNAVRDGRLTPSATCEDCGHDFTEFRREAHHESYERDRWLDVAWLCSRCHKRKHSK